MARSKGKGGRHLMTVEDIVKKDFDRLILKAGKEIFVKDYEYSKEEVIGVLISKYFKWELGSIVKVFESALEDANMDGAVEVKYND